ncbi:zinc finger, C2H2 type, partial [Oesophagostomum dentatum]
MNFASPAEEDISANTDFSRGHVRNCPIDLSKDIEHPVLEGTSAEDVTAQAADDYDSIYEEYVMGPRRGRRTATRMTRNRYHPYVVRGSTIVSLQGGDQHQITVPAVTMSFMQESEKRSASVDSFGYGLPEIVGTSDVTVPLIVGDQRALMEKPFKCPYCDHRSKEKGGLEKHIRSIHTLEAPYKCKYCNQSFKVQSNMVRHIRAHT